MVTDFRRKSIDIWCNIHGDMYIYIYIYIYITQKDHADSMQHCYYINIILNNPFIFQTS